MSIIERVSGRNRWAFLASFAVGIPAMILYRAEISLPGSQFQQDPMSAQQDAETQEQDSPDENLSPEAARNERLAKYLTGTRWTGRFTISGQEDRMPTEEHYEIIEAQKDTEGDFWNLTVRIKYGNKDVTLPLPSLEIKWAGETPVITVDRMTIPGMGVFDARVLIRKGQYAGTWAHGAQGEAGGGGHLFGKIEKMETEKKQ